VLEAAGPSCTVPVLRPAGPIAPIGTDRPEDRLLADARVSDDAVRRYAGGDRWSSDPTSLERPYHQCDPGDGECKRESCSKRPPSQARLGSRTPWLGWLGVGRLDRWVPGGPSSLEMTHRRQPKFRSRCGRLPRPRMGPGMSPGTSPSVTRGPTHSPRQRVASRREARRHSEGPSEPRLPETIPGRQHPSSLTFRPPQRSLMAWES